MREYYCYVYYDEHWQPYYVGKGCLERHRASRKISVPDLKHTQFFYFENEWQAIECEIELIALWGRKYDGGILENITLGGLGQLGCTGDLSPRGFLGKSHSNVVRNRLRTERTGTGNPMHGMTGSKNPFFGKQHSEETKQKMRNAWKMRKEKRNA